MRGVPLTTSNAGMTRLRRKGQASPATLYDCLNAYITIAGTIKPRPGTIIDTILPAGTKGLRAHDGKMHVFSHTPVTMTDDRYVNVVLRHPTDDTVAIREIHFAKPFMGFLYVVAAFEDGTQWHYWAEELDPWEANTNYSVGARVFPTTINGFAYKATRAGSPAPKWSADVRREVGDTIEPTVHNGYKYVCIAVTGTNPASGTSEPKWPTEEGATVTEVSYSQNDTTPPEPGDDGDDGTTRDDYPDGYLGDVLYKYYNPGGSKP